ncbi:MAG: NFACT family protein [Fusobacteriaceae bacterium]|jgi:predicted ribosome quality control (RQC) complex YloA/Tae2 family protein|nr:NFACT family protein [Fusobacteriaceae bacterium]
MFYIDGVSLFKIKEELKDELIGKKINKITKNTELSLSLHFGRRELVFSCNSSFPICYIAEEKEEALEGNTGITEILRKNLMNGELIDISQVGLDRILVFKFLKLNELGEEKLYNIYFEIMGKHSNFIFTDEKNIIIDLLKRFSLEENRLRALFPGVPYEQPIIIKKISPFSVSREEFEILLKENNILNKIEGIGKIFVENIRNYEDFIDVLNHKISPQIFYKDKKIILATVLNFHIKNYDEIKRFGSYNEIINYYINHLQLSQSFEVLKKFLLSNVEKKIKKDRKILAILNKEREENKNYEKYKEQGDILAANIFFVKKGMDQVEVYDFYNDCKISIPLDLKYSPKENLDRIYKKYNKIKRGVEANTRREKEIKEDLEYLNSIKLFIENSENTDNLKIIYDEIVSVGIVKNKDNVFIKKNKTKPSKKIKVFKYGEIIYKNVKILYGRNNLENDNLTFKVADKEDTWLHSKNIPGAHVILKTIDNKAITEDEILKGAQVASFFTSARIGEKILVDYTMKKFINKPKGGKPGFVTYINEKGIWVEKEANINTIINQ